MVDARMIQQKRVGITRNGGMHCSELKGTIQNDNKTARGKKRRRSLGEDHQAEGPAKEIAVVWCKLKRYSASKGLTKVLGWNRMCSVNLEAMHKCS